jgi:hypothetical protein
MSLRDEVQEEIDTAGRLLEQQRCADDRRARITQINKDLGGLNLVYKTHEPAPQQLTQFMDARSQEPWDIWARSIAKQVLDEQPDLTETQIGAIAEFVVGYVRDELAPLLDRLSALEVQLAALRVDADAGRAVTAQEQRRLKWLRGDIGGKRDDADA